MSNSVITLGFLAPPGHLVTLGYMPAVAPTVFVAGPVFREPPRRLTWSCDMQTEVKRPSEIRSWVWDYTQETEIAGTKTISSVIGITVTTVESPTTPDVQPTIGAPAISSNGKQVSAFVSGGTDGNTYQLVCLVQLSDGVSELARTGLLLVSSTAPIKPTQR